jgi:predicted acyltransferase
LLGVADNFSASFNFGAYNYPVKISRIASIDIFRGFAILTMALANYMDVVSIIPAWLKHAPDVGLTVIDLIAPFFIFAIGLTYGLSFRGRLERDGAFKTYSQFFTRYLAIIGLGAIISAAQTAVGQNPSGIDWGVLQAIGTAGLITLVVIRLPSVYRWIIGAGILIAYQIILDDFLLNLTIRSPHGGLFGSLNWAAMLILGTVLADLFHGEGRWKKAFPWASLAFLGAGIGLSFLLPVSKHRVSSSYVLISLGASVLLFLLFHWLTGRFNWKGRFLVVWGMNPLVLYFLHYLIIGIFFVPGIPAIFQAAPLWLVLLEMVVLIGGISAVAYWLDRKRIYISL